MLETFEMDAFHLNLHFCSTNYELYAKYVFDGYRLNGATDLNMVTHLMLT